ncbi:CPCC family cysteine-rich protein [Streptomyces sp. NPDC005474]|uniref:CPCC family cysteine-rich protein n=1 Tax=Streptomyces sp. NPDC005474 TaxID=3154878 RepID=UPI00345465DE
MHPTHPIRRRANERSGTRPAPWPGSYEICPVRFREDDGVQFRRPTMAGGANKVSLVDVQRNYRERRPRTGPGRPR